MNVREARTVAVVNSSDSVRDLIAATLEDDGYRTVMGHVDDFIRARASVAEYLRENDPIVLVWDVAPPYETNWLYLQGVMGSAEAAGRAFVVTTTNRRALADTIGENSAIELIGKPFDLEEISRAVKRADVSREQSP
jgi:DNA-binding NtrC family response regulator